jgi:hypothetical protein
MKPRGIILTVVLAVVVAMVLAIYFREPRYHGRTLSGWLRESQVKWNEGGDEAARPAVNAVRHIGVRGIPTLLRMMRKQTDNALVLKWKKLADRFEFLPRPFTAYEQNALGAQGIFLLGPDAAGAIPELMDIYRKDISFQSTDLAFACLITLLQNPQRDELLHEGLTNKEDHVRLQAYWELTPKSTPQSSIPLIIKGMADPSAHVQRSLAGKLRQFGTNALPAVPALVPLAVQGSTNLYYSMARDALILIDPATAAQVLTNGFYTYEQYTNQQSVNKRRDEENAKKFRARYGLPPPGPGPATNK